MSEDHPFERHYQIRPYVPVSLEVPSSGAAKGGARFAQGLNEALGGALRRADASDVIPAFGSPGGASVSAFRQEEASGSAADEPEAPSPVTYSEAELRAAEQAARAAGQAEGRKQAEAEAAREMDARRGVFEEAVARLNAAADMLNEVGTEAQLRTAGAFRAALERLFGTLMADADARARMLFRFFCDALREHGLEPLGGAELYVHPEDLERLTALMQESDRAGDAAFRFGGLKILPGKDVKPGAAELRWLRGGLIVTPEILLTAVREASQ